MFAGPGWAGDAWIGEYRIRDAHGERDLTVVRDETRVEYRLSGERIRLWRRIADGIELRELDPDAGRMIVYPPGDLRALDAEPEWDQLSALVDPTMRTGPGKPGGGAAFGHPITRYQGVDAQGRRVELDWLADAGLTARYSAGRRGKDAIRLLRLTQMPAERAFTAYDGLLEIDHTDLGDKVELPHDPHTAHR